MTSWLHRRWFGLWSRLHRDFDSTDPTAKRTARVIWTLLTGATCLVLGRTITWASRTVGASLELTTRLGVWILLSVFTVALVAVTAGPGRTRRPALITLVLVTGFILLMTLSGPL
ncbi:hypothetical protein [Streptomyces sp. NPDC015350]|uniref:hypothetical protein n=1 Tax=Streptomyces sp. NPDC015350 TaxID=3364955 RepID=UPI0036FA3545